MDAEPEQSPAAELNTLGRPRTPKQTLHLSIARLLWYEVMDGHVKRALADREIDRQLRLAKATWDDL